MRAGQASWGFERVGATGRPAAPRCPRAPRSRASAVRMRASRRIIVESIPVAARKSLGGTHRRRGAWETRNSSVNAGQPIRGVIREIKLRACGSCAISRSGACCRVSFDGSARVPVFTRSEEQPHPAGPRCRDQTGDAASRPWPNVGAEVRALCRPEAGHGQFRVIARLGLVIEIVRCPDEQARFGVVDPKEEIAGSARIARDERAVVGLAPVTVVAM